jgi:hypothetical protein
MHDFDCNDLALSEIDSDRVLSLQATLQEITIVLETAGRFDSSKNTALSPFVVNLSTEADGEELLHASSISPDHAQRWHSEVKS